MTMDMTEEQQQRQEHPPSFAEVMGEELGVNFDPGPAHDPGKYSSAARHARAVKSREQAAAERRDLAVIARAADEQDDELALEQALELVGRAQEIPTALRIRAARAARRSGTTIPTAEQHAAKALRNR